MTRTRTTRLALSRYADAAPPARRVISANGPPAQIAEMYQRQVLAQTKGGKKGKGADADDGFW